MKVLSLFDGISCGLQALKGLNIKVDKYYSFEVDKYAIQISLKNHPEIIKCGDVITSDFTKFKDIDILIGGRGANTGLYAIAQRGRYVNDGKNTKIEQRYETTYSQKANTITTVQKDSMLLSEYIIRKLTPIECERLQTLPDNYTRGVSNTQRYKMLGNGWTVEVIKHILSRMINDQEKH